MDEPPWVIFGRNSAYQPELGTSPSELVLGQMPRIPGDLVEHNGENFAELLQRLRTNAAQPPIPTAHHTKITPYFPKSAQEATHVMQKIGKPLPLGPQYQGPYPIQQRIGDSCLKIQVGNWANGKPRHELTHWNTCYPVPLTLDVDNAHKSKRGRKLNANAPTFVSGVAHNESIHGSEEAVIREN